MRKRKTTKTFDEVSFASKVVATYPNDRNEAKKWLDRYDLTAQMVRICSIISAWNQEVGNG